MERTAVEEGKRRWKNVTRGRHSYSNVCLLVTSPCPPAPPISLVLPCRLRKPVCECIIIIMRFHLSSSCDRQGGSPQGERLLSITHTGVMTRCIRKGVCVCLHVCVSFQNPLCGVFFIAVWLKMHKSIFHRSKTHSSCLS